MVAPLRRSGKLRYVLEEFETEPMPVHVAYSHSRMLSATVRAFVDLCVETLRKTGFD
jgi:DNA-binding transcriptional LysR family regulator